MKKKNIALALSLLMIAGSLAACEAEVIVDDSSAASSTTTSEVKSSDVETPDTHTHSFGEWGVTTPATCTDAGKETRTCECGETETRDVEATGHTIQPSGVCSVCKVDTSTEIKTGSSMTGAIGQVEYHHFTAVVGKYKFQHTGGSAPIDFKVFDPEMKEIEGAVWGTEFATATAGVYHVSWKSTNPSPYKLENVSHEHTYNYKGQCTIEGCPENVCINKVQAEGGQTTLGFTGAKTYYKMNCRPGEYTFSWAASFPESFAAYRADGTEVVNSTDYLVVRAAKLTLTTSEDMYFVLGKQGGSQWMCVNVA